MAWALAATIALGLFDKLNFLCFVEPIAAYNVVSDAHDAGLLWSATPLIVCDTYEHAYCVG